MPSFDVVSETNMQEIDNALNSAKRELSNRYDFKGSKSSIENDKESITILADDDMKLKALIEMLKTYLTRRNVDIKCLDFGTQEMASGGMIRLPIKFKKGLDQENAKKITKEIKEKGLKVQASIQGDQVRITGKKKDDLQEAIAYIKQLGLELPLQFVNFRD
jgi:cyclic-di-GMP-binding protein